MSTFVRQFQGFHTSLLLLPEERQTILANVRGHMRHHPLRIFKPARFGRRFGQARPA